MQAWNSLIDDAPRPVADRDDGDYQHDLRRAAEDERRNEARRQIGTRYRMSPLGRNVLAVAVVDSWDGGWDWAAYVDAVSGRKHEMEILPVVERGTKLRQEVAAALFPWLAIEKFRT